MDVFEAIRTVLAVREFQDKPVPEEAIRRIVESAHLTASSRNGQPWHFIVVRDPGAIRRLAEIATTGPYIAQAPLAVVVALEKSRFAESDAGRAIQSMVLTAWEQGIGSNWVGFHGLDGVKPLLGIPGELDVFAIIPFGYPARTLGMGKKQRKPLGQVAHSERFGEPFA
jgi:nitroreductase